MAPKARHRWSALGWLAALAAGVYAIDQGCKAIVVSVMTEGVVVPVLGPVLQFQFVRNPGAAFSFASGMTWVLTVLAAVVVAVIVWAAPRIRSRAWAVMLGVLLGGVLGNLTDRLFREPGFGLGHVIDFIAMPWLMPAIWNIADMAILTAMSIFLVLNIRGVRLDGSRPGAEPAAAEVDG
ncbi:MAG TPA: signal peptidase II [Microbacteriaceae bacterium]|nr:signal peptidase II [Microbacteriaceae bacterium]